MGVGRVPVIWGVPRHGRGRPTHDPSMWSRTAAVSSRGKTHSLVARRGAVSGARGTVEAAPRAREPLRRAVHGVAEQQLLEAGKAIRAAAKGILLVLKHQLAGDGEEGGGLAAGEPALLREPGTADVGRVRPGQPGVGRQESSAAVHTRRRTHATLKKWRSRRARSRAASNGRSWKIRASSLRPMRAIHVSMSHTATSHAAGAGCGARFHVRCIR